MPTVEYRADACKRCRTSEHVRSRWETWRSWALAAGIIAQSWRPSKDHRGYPRPGTRAHETAINALVHIAEKGKQESARVAAASALLDRGWGKPTQPLSGDKDAPPIGLSIEDQRREISERHERSRRLLEEVFAEVSAKEGASKC